LPVHSGMRVSRIAFSPDQRWLALGENTSTFGNIRVVVVDAVSFEEKGTLRFLPGITGSDGVMALEFFDDGKRLAIGTRRGEVLIADIEAMQVSERWQVHDKNVDDLALAEDDSIIVTSSRDGKVRWWEVASKKRLKEVTANGNRHLVPYGDDLLVTDNGLKKVALDPKVEGGTQDFSVPAKSRLIRSDPSWGILNTGNFGETTLYSEIGQPVRRFYSNRFPESIVAIKVGFGGRLFSAYGTTACEIWSLQDGLRIGDFQSRQIRTVDLDPFLPRVFIAEDNRVIAIPAEMPAQNYPVHPGRIADVSFSPSGESVLTTVLLGTRTQMHIYDLSDFLLQKSQIVDSAIAAIALEDSGSSILFDPKSKSVTRVTLKGGQSTELIANTEQADYLRLDRKRNRLWLTRKPVARSLFGVETPTFWQVVCYSLKDQKLVSNWSDKKDALLSGRSHYSDLFVGEEHVVAANENFIAYAKHEEPKEFNKISVTGHSISCLAEAGGKILAGTLGGAVLVIDLTAESVIEIGTTDGAITSMCSEDDLLWIGTASGEVLHAEVNENKLTVITSLGPFSNSVESILVTQSASLVLRVRGESSLKQVDIKDLRAQWHMVLDP
ncbi:MAG: WD40 repeat domain-containing protein, partial [Planctomycetota bacterium]